MFVFDQGEGPAVVFIPGLGADHTMYAPQFAAFTEFRRIGVDLRGNGRSPSLDGVPVADVLAVQADDVAEALRERGIDRAHLVGISYGGTVIETLMLRHPHLVASAVICDSLCDTRPRNAAERMLMWSARLQPAVLRHTPLRWQAASLRAVYKRWPGVADEMARVVTQGRMDELITQRRAVNAVQLEDALRGCRTPTLCLVGDFSSLAVGMMRRMHAALPNSAFAIIPNSFDPSNLCATDVFNAHVRDWVTRQETATAGG